MIELLPWWTLKGSVVLALAGTITLLLRRQPAALRHAVWASAIAAQLVIPFVGTLVPEQATIRVPPQRFAMRDGAAAAPAAVVAPITGVPAAETAAAPREPMDTGSVLRWIWIAGAVLVGLRLLAGTARIAAIARGSARVVDGEWLARTQSHTIALDIVRPVTLLWSERIPLPVTWGFIYPTILLPETARAWPETFRRHVLLHELAHVRRFDALTQLVTQLALAAFWFNPLLWFAAARMRAEAENACDDYVLRDGERPSAYATTLVELVRSHSGPTAPAFASLSVGRKSDLESRVGAIVQPARNCAAPGRPRLALAALATFAVVVPLSGIVREELSESEMPAVATARKARVMNCRPLYIDNEGNELQGMSGTLRRTKDEQPVYYFFHAFDGRCIEGMFSTVTNFTDDDRDIAPGAGVDALVRERVGDVDRVVYIRSAGNELTRRYLVNGRERAWDRDAREWYAALMPDFVRRTYAGIPHRTERIAAKSGVEGVLREVREIDDLDVRKLYLLALLDRRELSPAYLIDTGARLLRGSEAVIGSFLTELAEREGNRAEVRDPLLEAIEQLHSDVERRLVLEKLVAHASRETRIAAISRIDTLRSVVERRTLLETAAAYFLGNDERLNHAYFDAVDTVRDATELKDLLISLARRPSLPPSVIPRIMRVLERIPDAEDRKDVQRAFDVG